MLQPKSKTMIISIRNTKLQVAHLKKVGLSIECHIDKDRHSVSGVKKKRNGCPLIFKLRKKVKKKW